LVFLGPPGAGKGTQAERLKVDLGLNHLSTGDLLRAAVAAGTPLGKDAKRYMDAGDLVPDEVIVGMIRERLDVDGADDFLLDGFPRTDAQARALDEMLGDLGTGLDGVILLSVPRGALMERLTGRWLCRKCGRSYHESFAPYAGEPCEKGGSCDLYQRDDDTPEAIANRLDTYDAQTAPLISYYRDAGLLREIDGDQPPEGVYGQIAAAVAPPA
jgi:adenylate kinase